MADNTNVDTSQPSGDLSSPPAQPLIVNIEPPTPTPAPHHDEVVPHPQTSNTTADDAVTEDPFTPQRTSREPPLPAFASPHLLQLQALNEQHQTALKAQLEAAGVSAVDFLANNTTGQHGHHYPAPLHLDGISNFMPSSSLVIPHSPLNSAPTSADDGDAKDGDTISRSVSNSSLAAQYYARAAGGDFVDDTFSPHPPFSPSANGSDIKHSPSLNTITFNGPQPQSPSSEMQQAQHLHAANNPQTNTQSPSRAPQQQTQQSQQKSAAAQPKKGFFASLWSKKPAAGAAAAASDDKSKGSTPSDEVKVDPIPIYFTRLRRCLTHHEVNVSKLLAERKRAEQQSVEEIGQWINYSISSLASAAATYYHTHIMHLNTLFELEKKFLDNISDHYRLVEDVEKGKEPVEKIKNFMLNDKGEVRSQEEINQMFWPPDAAETKALCRSLWETAQNMELTYKEAQKRGVKRDSVNDRRKRLLDWILKAYHSRDTLSVDSFYHHPWDSRTQVAFNNVMCDQRGEEGKLVQRFMQMQVTHAARMTPNAIRNFLNVLVDCTMKSYSLDEKLLQIVRLFSERLIFPRIPSAMAALITPEEKDKSVILAKKMQWLRSLTPQQLDMSDELVPLGYHHKEYTPLFSPPGEYKPQTIPVDNTPLIPHNEHINSHQHQHSHTDNQSALVPVITTSPTPSITSQDAHHEDSSTHTTETSTSSSTSGNTLTVDAAPTVEAQSPTTGAVAFQFPVSKPLAMFEQFPAQNKMTDDVLPTQMVDLTFPYADAINILTQLNHDLVPADMYFHCVQAVRQVFVTAKQIAKTHRQREREQRAAEIVAAHLGETSTQHTDENKDKSAAPTHHAADVNAHFAPTNHSELHANNHSSTLPTPSADVLPSTSPASEAAPLLAAARPSSDTSDPVAAVAPQPVDDINLNADNLVPLMIWLVIHANVPNIHQYFGYIERFIPADLRNFGEAGMCSSMVESAIYHVQNLTPETLYNSRTQNALTELMSREDVPPPAETSFDTLSTSSLTTHVDASSPMSSLSNHSSVFDPASPRREPYAPLDLLSDNESPEPTAAHSSDVSDETPLIPTPTKVHAASDDIKTQVALDADHTTQEASLNVVHAHVTDHHLDGPMIASMHVQPSIPQAHNLHVDIALDTRTHYTQPQTQVETPAIAIHHTQHDVQTDNEHSAAVHTQSHTEQSHAQPTSSENVTSHSEPRVVILHETPPANETHEPTLTEEIHPVSGTHEAAAVEEPQSHHEPTVTEEQPHPPPETHHESIPTNETSVTADEHNSPEPLFGNGSAEETAPHVPTSDDNDVANKEALTDESSHVNPLDAFLADHTDDLNEEEPPKEEEMDDPEKASSNPLDDFLANADDFDEDENNNNH